MIYVVISHIDNGREFSNQGNENIIKKQRDCRVLRQPLTDLPENIKAYVESAKNENVKAERELAYTTLLCSLKAFFEINDPIIERDADGKPYLKQEGEKSIYFNISHSDGAVAVALSDEGEIGMDIQSDIDDKKAERLEKRYLSDLIYTNEKVIDEIFFGEIIDECLVLNGTVFENPLINSFSEKWTVLESLLKLSGKGFGGLSLICDLSKKAKTQVKSINIFNKKYSLAVSVYK
ncbi:MAG: hypothetical protein IJX97_06910 [Clostridia bacterium]|nr:hypothetical protein [Clostridia bacterium]